MQDAIGSVVFRDPDATRQATINGPEPGGARLAALHPRVAGSA